MYLTTSIIQNRIRSFNVKIRDNLLPRHAADSRTALQPCCVFKPCSLKALQPYSLTALPALQPHSLTAVQPHSPGNFLDHLKPPLHLPSRSLATKANPLSLPAGAGVDGGDEHK